MKYFLLSLYLFIFAFPATASDEIAKNAIDFMYQQQQNITKNLGIQNEKKRFLALYNEIDKTFATNDIYKFVLARNAKLFNQNQKQSIIEYFKKLILVTYAIDSKINVSDLRLELTNAISEKQQNGTYKIDVKGNVIDSQKIDLISVDFTVLYKNNEYRIYDIKIENINMLITFRNVFNNMMQDSYNDTDVLMKRIDKELNEIDNLMFGTPIITEEKEVFILQ